MKLTFSHPVKPHNVTKVWGVVDPKYVQMNLPFTRHNGIDIRLTVGQLIYAPFDCRVTVTELDPTKNPSGVFICLLSDNEYDFDDGKRASIEITFMHCSGLLVQKGQSIKLGQAVALGGNTGNSDGPHTHMQPIRVRVNPDGSYDAIDDDVDVYRTFDPEPYFDSTFAADILQNNTVNLTPSINSIPDTMLFPRYLAEGAMGEDVKLLQKILNSDHDTQITSAGIGSPGQETTLFGDLTKQAVEKFQIKYTISSAGDPGYGIVGPKTRQKLQELYGKNFSR